MIVFAKQFVVSSGLQKIISYFIRALHKPVITGFDCEYWNDSNIDDFIEKLKNIKDRLDSYIVTDEVKVSEKKITIQTSDGQKSMIRSLRIMKMHEFVTEFDEKENMEDIELDIADLLK